MTMTEDPYVYAASDFYKKPTWMLRGNCMGLVDETEDGSIMYPDRSNGDVTFAKNICNGVKAKAAKTKADGTVITAAQPARPACPVKDQCLEYALAEGERWGVWGGKSERERRYLQRARKRALKLAAAAKAPAPKKLPSKTVTKVVVRKPVARKKVTTS